MLDALVVYLPCVAELSFITSVQRLFPQQVGSEIVRTVQLLLRQNRVLRLGQHLAGLIDLRYCQLSRHQ